METYLDLLDNASLFQLLVRLHYADLWNLIKVRPRLLQLTWTEYFKDAWKKYNITNIVTYNAMPTMKYEHVETDRGGLRHGKTVIYDNNNKICKSAEFTQDVLNGEIYETFPDGQYSNKNYVNGLQHGLTKYGFLDDNNCVTHWSYQNDVLNGLAKKYNVGEAIEWQQFINGKTHGKRYTWSDNGTLRKIESFKHGNSAGRQVIFYSNGVKHKEYTFVNSKTHGDYFQWHSNGNLYKHERYDYGQLRSSTTYK